MGLMDVTNLKACPVPRKSTRAKGRKPTLVRYLGKRVRLIHELAQLRTAEEFLHGSNNWPDVHQLRRCRRVRVLDRHPLLDDTLHAEQAHPELVLDQFTDCANPTITEMINVVRTVLVPVQPDQLTNNGHQVIHIKRAISAPETPKPAVQLVATDSAQVIST